MLHSAQTCHAWLGPYSVKYLQLCRPKGLQYCEQIQHFCRQRIYETSGTFCLSVYCQIYETIGWLCNKNRYMNDSDQKAASYTVRLECAALQFEELSRDLQIKSQTSLCFFAFQQEHYLKGHLMLREHVSLFFLPSLSHSYVYCPRGSEISLPSFHSRITQHVGGFQVHLDSSPRAKHCSCACVVLQLLFFSAFIL